MVFNFLGKKGQVRNIINKVDSIYVLFFMAVSVFFSYLLYNVNTIISNFTNIEILLGNPEQILAPLASVVIFIFVLLVVYGAQHAFLKIFCKIQENISIGEYIGSLTNSILGKVFKYVLLIGSALFAADLISWVFFYFKQIITNSQYLSLIFSLTLANLHPYTSLLFMAIFSIGIAYSRSKSNNYDYNAAKKELKTGFIVGVLAGLLLAICLILLLPFNLVIAVLIGFIALVLCVLLCSTWELLLTTRSTKTLNYKLKYIFTILVIFCLLWLFQIPRISTILLALSLIAAAIFAVAYIRAYLQDVARRYRQY